MSLYTPPSGIQKRVLGSRGLENLKNIRPCLIQMLVLLELLLELLLVLLLLLLLLLLIFVILLLWW